MNKQNESESLPFISRLFVGVFNEFEAEVVFAEKGMVSPREAHPFLELIVFVEGKFEITYDNIDEPEVIVAPAMREITAGTMHQVTPLADHNKAVIIHPDRTE